MKWFFSFIITLSSVSALAQPVTTINGSEIQLLGRGIVNKKTNETLALVCLNDCLNARMAYFTPSSQNGFLFGPTFKIQTNPELTPDQEMKHFLKKFTQTYRRFRRNDNLSSHYGKMQGKMGLVALGSAGLLGLATISASPVLLPAAASVFLVGGAAIILTPGLFKYTPEIATFDDQKGWNWATQPKKTSVKSFDRIISMLESDGSSEPLKPYRELN